MMNDDLVVLLEFEKMLRESFKDFIVDLTRDNNIIIVSFFYIFMNDTLIARNCIPITDVYVYVENQNIYDFFVFEMVFSLSKLIYSESEIQDE